MFSLGHRRDIGAGSFRPSALVAAAACACVIAVAFGTVASAAQTQPVCSSAIPSGCFIEANIGGSVQAQGFTPNSSVRFEVYASSGGALIAGPVTRDSDGTGFAAYTPPSSVAVGNHFEVTDVASGIVKKLDILPLTVDTVDTGTDTVAGTAPAGASVNVNLEHPSAGTVVVANSAGAWQADFHALGVDIVGTTSVGAWIFDDDGDKTVAAPANGCPATQHGVFWDCSVSGSLEIDSIQVIWATPNSDVRLQALDSSGDSIWGPVVKKTDADGNLQGELLGFDAGIDLVAGDRIEMTDLASSTTKTLTLIPLTMDSVDPDTDVITGTAPAGTVVRIGGDSGPGAVQPVTVTTDSSGNWRADYRALIGYDIKSTDAFYAWAFDSDGDVTSDVLGAPLDNCTPGPDTICGTAGPDSIRPTGGSTALGSSLIKRAGTLASSSRAAKRTRTVHAGPGDDILLAVAKAPLRQLRLDVGTGSIDRVVVKAGPKLPRRTKALPHVIVSGRSHEMIVVLPAHAGNLVVKVTGASGPDRVSTRNLGGHGKSRGGYTIAGKAGNDRLSGGDGADRLDGGSGNDKLNGGKGNDVLIGGPGHDVLNGGPGHDICYKGKGDRVKACEVVRQGK
jgi:Ca2+-binding RTX toxin-like protein